jgi:hypothetical protein
MLEALICCGTDILSIFTLRFKLPTDVIFPLESIEKTIPTESNAFGVALTVKFEAKFNEAAFA